MVAKTPRTPKTPTAAKSIKTGAELKSTSPAAVELGKVGGITFTMEVWPEIPVTSGRARSSLELPFKSWFPQMAHNAHVFLPTRFWTDERNVDPERVTPAYVKSKIRDAFRKWQADDAEGRKGHSLVLIARDPGDDNGRFTEAGMSVFMQIAK